MAILANLRGINLFSSKPPRPTNNNNSKPPPPPSPPIPVPRYPPLYKSKRTSSSSSSSSSSSHQQQEKKQNPPPPPPPPTYHSSSSSSSPALKSFHRQTKYYKPVSEGVLTTSDGDRSVIIGESGVSYLLPGAPFEFQFSYSETPKVKPLALREPAFLPFAPPTMPRPWTGRPPLKKSKKKIPLFDSFNPTTPPGSSSTKHLEMPRPIELGKYPKDTKTREEILGEPLTKAEIRMLIQPHLSHNRQVNLGRDGLTHNMLELVHSHWKRDRVCKVRCLGVPTVDMDNVCKHLEEKTGGKIIHRIGGVVCLFRGRNYNYLTRPQYPVMLWKPATPVYPKLIQEAPEGLTKFEADHLRAKGKNLLPICKLAKNGVYLNLVKDVREAFEGSILVKIDCRRMHASDYKKIGAKLRDLVPCVLLSFDDEQILMWRGKEWKSMYPEGQSPVSVFDPSNNITSSSSDCRREKDASTSQNALFPTPDDTEQGIGNSSSEIQRPNTSMPVSSPRILSLWKRALESNQALLLDKIDVGPDELLEKVEAFSGTLQVTEHPYPALIMSSNSDTITSDPEHEDGSEIDDYDDEDDFDVYDNGLFEVAESVPQGSLPVDHIAEQLNLDY